MWRNVIYITTNNQSNSAKDIPSNHSEWRASEFTPIKIPYQLQELKYEFLNSPSVEQNFIYLSFSLQCCWITGHLKWWPVLWLYSACWIKALSSLHLYGQSLNTEHLRMLFACLVHSPAVNISSFVCCKYKKWYRI